MTKNFAELTAIQAEIEINRDVIDKTENFKKTIKKIEVVKVDVPYNVTQCTICPGIAGICHKKCDFGNG